MQSSDRLAGYSIFLEHSSSCSTFMNVAVALHNTRCQKGRESRSCYIQHWNMNDSVVLIVVKVCRSDAVCMNANLKLDIFAHRKSGKIEIHVVFM
jgi:hypothetical protein